MSELPAMPMFWDAYLADTTHLSLEEHGAYLLLLGAMWRRNCWIPDDDKDNARILGLTAGKWKKIKARLEPFLIFEGGEISQKKLQEVWKKSKEISAQNREKAFKRWDAQSSKNKGLGDAGGYAAAMPEHMHPDPNPNIDDDDTRARARSSSFRGSLLEACGVDPISGLTPSGGTLGTRSHMHEAERWHSELGLSEAECLEVVRDVMGRKAGGPPASFKYFNGAMQERAAQKAAPKLSPMPGEANGRQSKAEQRERIKQNAIRLFQARTIR